MDNRKLTMKHWFDIAFTLNAILWTWPVAVFAGISIWITMGRPIVFRQKRAGYKGVPFTLYKFRTMRSAVDDNGKLLPDSERLTSFGRFLRKTSLDEWPQLWNVLRGDMSLVGPRPLLVEYLTAYTEEHSRRHLVRPGITGLAQISGRQSIPFSQRLDLDVFYVDNFSLWLDAKILLLTLPRVMMSKGVISGQDVNEVDDLKLSVDLQRTSHNNGLN